MLGMRIDAGLDVRAAPGATLSLSYSGQVGGHVHDHGIKGSFIWNF
jgi:uncharacterized protein with beta-barrel porin domain